MVDIRLWRHNNRRNGSVHLATLTDGRYGREYSNPLYAHEMRACTRLSFLAADRHPDSLPAYRHPKPVQGCFDFTSSTRLSQRQV
jgi:hypothetical protein